MSDELSNATRIAALEEQVRQLTADNAFMRGFINNEDVRSDFPTATAMRETLDSLRQSIYAACAGSGCVNAHELRVALDRERERCGVLEAEVKAWHAAEHLRKDEPHNEFMRLAEARFRTRETHAIDAAKFVGGLTLARNQPCGCVVCQCKDDNQCHGCGAKHCGTHPVGEIPNKKFVGGG